MNHQRSIIFFLRNSILLSQDISEYGHIYLTQYLNRKFQIKICLVDFRKISNLLIGFICFLNYQFSKSATVFRLSAIM